jgi:hypothetical protein
MRNGERWNANDSDTVFAVLAHAFAAQRGGRCHRVDGSELTLVVVPSADSVPNDGRPPQSRSRRDAH